MGANQSQPNAPTQHVFAADAPVRFSSEMVNSLQSSPETDSTRARNLELQIQSRVTSELERLQAEENKRLADISTKISEEPDTAASDASSSSILTQAAEKITGKDLSGNKQPLSRDVVSKDIEELRRKLQGRKKVEQMDRAVEKAKDELVQCLRTNDRRPLDCWKEVENFRHEVGRLEKEFVERTIR